ncbi:UNVERIFIED_CONTAM: hypothetical protein Slati_0617900 [Sesamum latifolium]|uniref:B3 domain-containing protein n=1 Tax=Sesamum latifolium TaxID=2727402 RepID=A0AAW2Y2F1_9LAMI
MEKMDKIRLFGLDIYVPRRDDTPTPVQQSDQRDDHVVPAAAAADDDDDHDHVDTTLRLVVPRNMDRVRVYNPVPLQSFHPSMALDPSLQFGGNRPDENPYEEDALSLSLGVSRTNDLKKRGKQSKRKQNNVAAERKPAKRRRSADQELEPAIPSLEEIPRLLEKIQLSNGTNPVFLYRKSLQHSDVRADQNRLFLTKCEKLMEYLTEEERNTAIERKEGLEVFAVDSHERKFYKLHLAKWPSLTMMVLNSDWKKLVKRTTRAQRTGLKFGAIEETGSCILLSTSGDLQEQKLMIKAMLQVQALALPLPLPLAHPQLNRVVNQFIFSTFISAVGIDNEYS